MNSELELTWITFDKVVNGKPTKYAVRADLIVELTECDDKTTWVHTKLDEAGSDIQVVGEFQAVLEHVIKSSSGGWLEDDPHSVPPPDAEVAPCPDHGAPFVEIRTQVDEEGESTGSPEKVWACGCAEQL